MKRLVALVAAVVLLTPVVTSAGPVAKYNNAGQLLWARSAGLWKANSDS